MSKHPSRGYAWGRAGRGAQGFAGQNGQPSIVAQGLSCSQASPLASGTCTVTPAPCGVDILGSTTLDSNPAGIAPNVDGTLTVTAGDACQFQPMAAYLAGYERQTGTEIANANRLPMLLIRLDVGNVAALRRLGNAGSGIITDPFNAQQCSPLAIRVGPFSSTNEQNMTWVLRNINIVTIHMFLDVWGFAIS